MTKTNFLHVVHVLRGFTFAGFVRYLMMKVRGRELLVAGACNCCGSCCRNLSLDDGNGWIRQEKDFHRIVTHQPKYSCFVIIGKDNFGILQFKCSHLLENGRCGNYRERFLFCADFPDKDLLFCGGCLPKGCGYRIETVVPFAKILTSSIEKYNEKDPHS